MLSLIPPSVEPQASKGAVSTRVPLDEHPLPTLRVRRRYNEENDVTLFTGRCQQLLKRLTPKSVSLILTSPPYNIGKVYEGKRSLDAYLAEIREVLDLICGTLKDDGALCLQIGNVLVGSTKRPVPLDMLLYDDFVKRGFFVQNRIVWHFEHGKNRDRRLSGRHETIVWLTRDEKQFTFNIDAVRAPQKYPGKKAYRGPRKGEYLSNPLGKNPGDVWVFPNVKQNHPEKTVHPCQFPFELAERAVLAFSNHGDLVVDPFMGVGTTALAAAMFQRRFAGADTQREYVELAQARLRLLMRGQLRLRRMNTPIRVAGGRLTIPPWDKCSASGPELGARPHSPQNR